MKLLIAGSRGFLGSAVGQSSARLGYHVVGIGRSSQPDVDWPGEYRQADIANADLTHLVEKFAPDAIVHAAGSSSVRQSFDRPAEDLRAAVDTWTNVLEAVRRSGLRPRVVFLSSAAVYGETAALPIAEDTPVAPISPYGYHKHACEWIGREYAACFGIPVLIARLFSVYGPRQRKLLVWELFQRIIRRSDEGISLDGTGRETRDYLYQDDAADAVVRLCSAVIPSTWAVAPAINVASGIETPIIEVAETLRRLCDDHRDLRPRGQARIGDPARWRADVTRLRQTLPEWQPRALERGLAACVATWRGVQPS